MGLVVIFIWWHLDSVNMAEYPPALALADDTPYRRDD